MPGDTTTGDQAMAMAELTQQMATLVATFNQLAQNGQFQGTTTSNTTDKQRLADALASRIPMFSYEPEEEKTFEIWYQRYEDFFTKDGSTLSDDALVRLILSKLSLKDYNHYANRILPKVPSNFKFNETITKLTDTFKSTSSIFRKRQDFLRTEYHGTGIEEYTGTILRRFTSSEFKKMSDDQICAMIWINGMRDVEYTDIRTRALQIMETKPHITLLELEADVKRLLDIKADSKSLASPAPEVNAIHKQHQQKNMQKNDKTSEKQPPSACFRCGGSHWAKDCKYLEVTCNFCKKIGHLEKCCRTKKQGSKSQKVKSVIIGSATTTGSTRIYRMVRINGKDLKMQLDTGADVTLINVQDWQSIGSPKLTTAKIKVKSANYQPIKILGSFKCNFEIDGKSAIGTAHVAETGTLLGTDWISKDLPLWNALHGSKLINSTISGVGSACDYLDDSREKLKNELKVDFPDTFKLGLGTCSKAKAELVLKTDAKPIFRKARPVPYAALSDVSQEIDRLVEQGVLTPVDHAEWAAPIVIVRKKNGSLRMCADFSTGLNDSLEHHQHPLPTSDDIFTKLNGGMYFSQIDLAEAYLQIEVDDDSKKLLCINTHKGLYLFNRLPFGVKSAPGIFQQIMDALISGIDGVSVYLDDIIITGRTEKEHNERVHKVIKRINDYGFRMRIEKCTFLEKELTFLGFKIDAHGRRPDPAKVEAIKQMPIPQNVSQVRSFLGLIQFYGTFVKELFRLRPPLDALTKKDADFVWTHQCQKSFEKIKEVLQSDLLLTHYDPHLPIIIAADASQYGIGAVISHRFPDGSEKAIYHISKALTKPQQGYSQIEKEAFGLITAVTKFHKFIHGRKFTLKTDHKPLLAIFGDKKGVPIYSANRLQRYATILLNYDFRMEYVNTNDFGQADALSRLIGEQQQNKEQEDQVIAQVEVDIMANLAQNCERLPVTAEMIRTYTKTDKTLMLAMKYTTTDTWPKMEKGSQLWALSNRKDQLSIVQECLMMGERVVIPTSLRNQVLKMLHRAHPGIVRMKQLARSLVYWPSIDSDIAQLVKSCEDCARAAKDPIKNTLYTWQKSTAPWQRVHADFCGPINGIYYLIVVDSFSKWPEVIPTKSITSLATIEIFRKIFARFGNPENLVTDNGTQFTSSQFRDFCNEAGINHIRAPPYHPQSNGQAERFVDNLKRSLCKLKGEETTDTAIQIFLQNYRSTPCASSFNQLSPAENFVGRKIRTSLDLLLPSKNSNGERDVKMEKQFNQHHGARPKDFKVGEKVYVKDNRNLTSTTWIPGFVQRRLGHTLYTVKTESDDIWTKHSNQLRRREAPPKFDTIMELWETDRIDVDPTNPTDTTVSYNLTPAPPISQTQTMSTPMLPPLPPLRRSTRTTKPVTQFVVDPQKKSYKK